MSLGNITYKNIVDTVKTWIKSNCKNITGYADISDAVKNGYSYTIGSSSAGAAYSESASCVLSSPLNGTISSTVVDTDMNNFLQSIGVLSILNENINPTQFYKFINDICCFCCTKLAFITSQPNASTNQVRYLIYWTNNTNYTYTQNIISSTDVNFLINASDVNKMWRNIVDMMTRISGNIRVVPVNYTFSLS